jgi:phosphohistidine phosphatase SixA
MSPSAIAGHGGNRHEGLTATFPDSSSGNDTFDVMASVLVAGRMQMRPSSADRRCVMLRLASALLRMPVRPSSIRFGLFLMFATLAQGALADEAAWAALRQGGVAVMRHALAPGTGDPPDFDLESCASQRGLSEEGRAQAQRAGDAFRQHGIAAARVLSSRWCRARETAELLALGPVEVLPDLDSFFGDVATAAEQTRDLRAFIARAPADRPLILVTHQVNITALTGVVPGSGEVVVLERAPSGFRVVGRIPL